MTRGSVVEPRVVAFERAAQNHNMEPEQAADNIHSAAKKLKEQGPIQ